MNIRREVKNILKSKSRLDVFTMDRYDTVKQVLNYQCKKDPWFKQYCQLDPLNKAQWISDHLIICVDKKLI